MMRSSRIVFGIGLLVLATSLWLAWPRVAMAQDTTTAELPLKQGWNLVSLPLVPESSDPVTIFAPIAGSYTQVWTYINSPAGGQWKGYGAGTPHDLTELNETMGFWVEVTADVTLTITGTEPSGATIQLYSGRNLVGYPHTISRPAALVLDGVSYESVLAYDPTDPDDPWKQYDPDAPAFANDLNRMEQGKGYWIDVPAETTYSLPPLLPVEDHCGTISADEIWEGDVVHRVTCDVTVSAGVTLTVEAGAVVKFSSSSIGLTVNGALRAQGTADRRVVLTSYKDDSYGGDTNGDGSASLPSPGDWSGIQVHDNGQLSFDHAIMRYGGRGGGGMIRGDVSSAANAAVSIAVNDSVVEHSTYGLYLHDQDASQRSTLSVSNSTFHNNGNSGLYASGGLGDVTLTSSTFADNGDEWTYGAHIQSATTVVATGNTFSRNGAGFFMSATDATVTDNVFADNGSAHGYLSVDGTFTFGGNTASGPPRLLTLNGNIGSDLVLDTGVPCYGIDSWLSIAAGHSLIVHPGVIVKSQYGGLEIHGTLSVQGIAADPVVFTSWKDDSYGGDTNGDGSASLPSPGDWSGIQVHDNGQLSFDHAIMRYGGRGGGGMIRGDVSSAANAAVSIAVNDSVVEHSTYGLYLHDQDASQRSTLSVSNSTFHNNGNSGLYASGSIRDVIITGSIFAENGDTGARVGSENTAIARNNSFYGNGTYGLYNHSDVPIDARYSYWGSNDGPAPYGSGDAINTWEEWDPVCECYVTVPAVIFTPWRNDGGEVVGPPPPQTGGTPSNPNTSWEAEPVNVVFGNYIYQYTDLAFPTRGEDFAFRRTYNSASTDDGPLGPGWTHTYNITATQTTTNTVVVRREDGRKDLYTDAGNGTYLSPPGIYDTLTCDADHFVLTRKDQVVYTFNADGTLATITDPNGNTTSLTYSGGKLTTVTGPAGRQVTFTYSGNLLTQISDPLGRTVSFGYTSGRLTSVTDLRGQTSTYAYDGAGRLQTITDANGHTFVNNVYDSEGRVIEQRDALNNLTTFSYNPDAGRTTVINPRGYATVHEYDSAYRITAMTDALGNTGSYTYDANNNRTSVTDKRGNTTSYTYDSRGNVLTINDPLGFTRTFTYDAQNNLTSRTDARGYTTNYVYDANGNLTSTTDPLGNTTTFAYDGFGKMTSTTDANGNTTQYQYDTYGHQTAVIDALGNATAFTYDLVGRKLMETDPLGRATTYTYDAANHLLTISEPLGKITTYTYDPVGNRISVTDPRGGVTHYAYDEKDLLVSVTDPLGHTTSCGYDSVGNQTVVTDALGHATIYTYDALNRRSSVTDPLGNSTNYQYDANGNRTRLTDANGIVTQYAYDALNRLVSVTDSEGGTVSYSYDPAGNRISMTDTNGHVSTYSYDPLNRLVTVTDPLAHTVTYAYDPVGNRISETKADGTLISYSYDPLNRLIETSAPGLSTQYGYDGVGSRTTMTDTLGVTTYTYDQLNRLIQTAGPNGTLQYGYDLNHNCTHLTYPDGKVVTYAYDLANRLTTTTDWASHVTTYTYDNADRQAAVQYPNATQAGYIYDDADRLLSIEHTSPVSGTIAVFTYTVDAVGNRLTMQDLDGTTSYSYDDLYRLTNVTYPDGEAVTYTYDPMGNRTDMTSSVYGATTYTYDDGDRLLSYTGPGGTTNLTWDANGNMTGKGGGVYTYGALNRLTQVVSGTTTVQFAYDGDGVRLGKTVNGTATHYVQDVAVPLPVVLTETTGGHTSQYLYGYDLIARDDAAGSPTFYHADGLGSTRALSNLAGQRTDSYSYDVFGAVRSHTGNSAQPYTFAGEQMDDELGLVYLRARYYDPQVGRFVSADAVPPIPILPQTINRYPYAGNNPVMLTDSSGKLLGTVIIIGGGAVVVYKVGQWVVDWVGFLDSADKTSNDNKEYWRAIDEGDWERASELEEKRAHQLRDTLKRGAKTAWDTPYGTSVSGPPPTSFGVWDAISEIAGFAIDKAEGAINWFRGLFRPGEVRGATTTPGGFGGGGGTSWGGPPSGGK